MIWYVVQMQQLLSQQEQLSRQQQETERRLMDDHVPGFGTQSKISAKSPPLSAGDQVGLDIHFSSHKYMILTMKLFFICNCNASYVRVVLEHCNWFCSVELPIYHHIYRMLPLIKHVLLTVELDVSLGRRGQWRGRRGRGM